MQYNVPLRDKNWFQTGGAAKFFAAPTTITEFQEALAYARTHSLEVFVLGKGANVLISDEGFDGLVIQPQLVGIEANGISVKAGSGMTMENLINYCLENNILGLEEFSGIPGTVGGSVFINLHYYDFLLEQFLVEAEIIDAATGEIATVPKEWFAFGYDTSRLKNGTHYLISATFALKKATELETAYARGRAVEIIRHRVKRYPYLYTCGSFFRNFHDNEVTLTTPDGKKMIYVAYYLDKIGVKGTLSIGGARVSHQHANMLVSSDKATSADIVELARTMQKLVYDTFGVIPQPECLLIGFKEYPLLR